MQANLAAGEEELRFEDLPVQALGDDQGRRLEFCEEPEEGLGQHPAVLALHREHLEGRHRVDHDPLVALLRPLEMVSELLFDHLLDAVHVDLEGADPGRLSDLRDVLHVPDIEGRADVDHGPLPLVGPNVRGCVEDLEPVEVPPERRHVRLDLDRGLVKGDEQARFVLAEPLEQEVR